MSAAGANARATILVLMACLWLFSSGRAMQGGVTDRYRKLGVAQVTLYNELLSTYQAKLEEEQQLKRRIELLQSKKDSAKHEETTTITPTRSLIGTPLWSNKYVSIEASAAAVLVASVLGAIIGRSLG